MSDWRRIKRSRLPANLPVVSTVVAYLLLRETQAPQWVWGVAGTLGALIWIASIVAVVKEEHVDPLAP